MRNKRSKKNIYAELKQSLADAQTYERGGAIDLRVTNFPGPLKAIRPREIRRIRISLKASQLAFASFLGVSAKAVQSWEQGRRRPQKSALRLLNIAKKNPAALLT